MAARAVTPPSLKAAGPTAKEKKYDRQLRLWAASGQEALEHANILLLNAGPGVVGVETLKNLILPGVGNFTIVDEAKVTEKDLGVNFFLTEASVGKSRAEETCKYLAELNPEVNGQAIQQSVEEYIEFPNRLGLHSLILVIGPSHLVQVISEHASKRTIPLFYIHSTGFYSHFSVQLPKKFPVVDTHPDPASTQDLRLVNPWRELLLYKDQKFGKLDSMSDHDHSHVPYVILLLYYLTEWKASHGGNPPASYSEKKDFKVIVEKGARTNNAEGGEENFDEAAAAVLKSLNPPSISSGLREVLEDEECQIPRSGNFWYMAHGIHAFLQKHNGLLPLPGSLPDMKAQSADYIQLQTIYRNKARADLAEVTATVRNLEDRNSSTQLVPETEIEAFCKNAAFVKLIRGRSLRLWHQPSSVDWAGREKTLCRQLQDPDSLFPIYIAFQAYDDFHAFLASQSKSTINAKDSGRSVEPNMCIDHMTQYAEELIDRLLEAGRGEEEDDKVTIRVRVEDVLKELDRADGAELHNISALTGGMVAQEVIKVITKQYVPVDNSCVFDGIASKTAVLNI